MNLERLTFQKMMWNLLTPEKPYVMVESEQGEYCCVIDTTRSNELIALAL